MTIAIADFRKVTGAIGMTVEDVGTKKGELDARDLVKLNGQPISYESAVETYVRMNSIPSPQPAPQPRVTITRSWEIGRANWPSQIVREMRRAGRLEPTLKVTVEDLGGFLAKTIVMRIEGPEEDARDFARRIDNYINRLARDY